jgi:hypothetical protein
MMHCATGFFPKAESCTEDWVFQKSVVRTRHIGDREGTSPAARDGPGQTKAD